MGFFDMFRKPEPIIKTKVKRVYAGANTGRLFNDFQATDTTADRELKDALRTLRNRSRDLARNNEYVKRYLELLKDNIVGHKGATLQVKALDPNGLLDNYGNSLIENAFKQWGRLGSCTLDGRLSWVDCQKLVVESLARDGEAFVVLHDFKGSIALQFLEADKIDETLNQRLKNGGEIRMGVELDGNYRPVAYYVKNTANDIDGLGGTYGGKHTRIPAEKMVHVYRMLRAGQTRGEPWLAPALSSIKMLDGYREAAIVNARVGASKMGFFTSPAGDGFVPDALDGEVPIMSADSGSFVQLPEGVSFQSFDPQYPNGEFDVFHKSVLKGIASALGVSYTSLANDLEATSYSSIRSGSLLERDTYQNHQAFFIDHFIRPVYEKWLMVKLGSDSFNLPERKFDKFANASEFRCRAWSWVDPQKEMTAAITGLQSGILSLQDVASTYGKDTEELLAQIQRDRSLMEQFGVSYALEPYGAPVAPPIQPDEEV